MTIRIRWIALSAFFAFLAMACAAPGGPNYIGAGIAGVAAIVFLAVGIWDSTREDRYFLEDPDHKDRR